MQMGCEPGLQEPSVWEEADQKSKVSPALMRQSPGEWEPRGGPTPGYGTAEGACREGVSFVKNMKGAPSRGRHTGQGSGV